MTLANPVIDKAVAYITHGDRLLVFSHVGMPEAGIQVPAGTIEPGELPEDAVLREAWEETGLATLCVRSFLGVPELDVTPFGRDEIYRRHYFHLELTGAASESWIHFEQDPSDGGPPVEFELFWAPLDNVPELAADVGSTLDQFTGEAR
ncbi:MAG: NUDIX domain-containing protein [SAR202 cluster bacterium]|jgi:8-oxo-dGTP pyrophosphatase MutT (NUDIX family)|nr:NUDIX domain-containing protein [SAR202 cluster bacterium]MDP7102812.1 NUDIX domain-containing protein [SAR202 cluster bacterium]MDP7224293.1 NUDIX domain-containing protein [SAR202 cluster bacterium]MDP7413958.1 NUDIX domain-containing protein [SAR202 cluster bacterium]HJO81935.1 NUDIX domain-containing protein [SAR202 cluster bacterium]